MNDKLIYYATWCVTNPNYYINFDGLNAHFRDAIKDIDIEFVIEDINIELVIGEFFYKLE